MHTEFDAALHIIDIVPATLFSAKELIAVGQAIAAGGGYHLKVNPGYGLGSTFEELSLLKRVQKTFPFIEEFRVLKERGGHLNV